MLNKYYETIMNKAEKLLDKKCETCLDYGVCWSSNNLKENACEHWTPEYNLLENKIIEIENKR